MIQDSVSNALEDERLASDMAAATGESIDIVVVVPPSSDVSGTIIPDEDESSDTKSVGGILNKVPQEAILGGGAGLGLASVIVVGLFAKRRIRKAKLNKKTKGLRFDDTLGIVVSGDRDGSFNGIDYGKRDSFNGIALGNVSSGEGDDMRLSANPMHNKVKAKKVSKSDALGLDDLPDYVQRSASFNTKKKKAIVRKPSKWCCQVEGRV